MPLSGPDMLPGATTGAGTHLGTIAVSVGMVAGTTPGIRLDIMAAGTVCMILGTMAIMAGTVAGTILGTMATAGVIPTTGMVGLTAISV